jgi:hypothetical protein
VITRYFEFSTRLTPALEPCGHISKVSRGVRLRENLPYNTDRGNEKADSPSCPVVPVIMLAKLPASAVSGTSASLIDGSIAGNEVTTSQTEASDSSTSAARTVTMCATADQWVSYNSFRVVIETWRSR